MRLGELMIFLKRSFSYEKPIKRITETEQLQNKKQLKEIFCRRNFLDDCVKTDLI